VLICVEPLGHVQGTGAFNSSPHGELLGDAVQVAESLGG